MYTKEKIRKYLKKDINKYQKHCKKYGYDKHKYSLINYFNGKNQIKRINGELRVYPTKAKKLKSLPNSFKFENLLPIFKGE